MRRTRSFLLSWVSVFTFAVLSGMIVAACSQQTDEPTQTPEQAESAQTPESADTTGTPVEPDATETAAPAKTVGGSGTIETVGEGTDQLTVVKISGNRYELGYWYGKLLADQIGETWKLVQAMATKEGIPLEIFEGAAAQMWKPEFFDTAAWETEMQGIADGCADGGHPEITLAVLRKISALPDLSEYNCSLFIAWGKATAGGEMYQMRNLDWAMDTGFQDYPVVAIYTPTDGVKHAVVGFAGVMGVVVGGMNVEGLAASEIMGHFCDEETLAGIPFPFLLRDVIYFDKSLDEALTRMKTATRTNMYHYGIGDPNAEDPKGRLLFTSNTRFDEYKDNDKVEPHPCADLAPFHESLDDVVYWKNHNGRDNAVVYTAINNEYGNMDAQGAIRVAQAACVDSTLVSIIYHNSANEMWIAFAEGTTPGPRCAYVQVKID